MTFPTTAIPTTNLNSSSDDPSQARADLLQAVESLNTIIDEAGQAYGVALLSANGKLTAGQIPESITTTGQFTLTAGDNVISLQSLLRLQRVPATVLAGFTNMIAGDIVLGTDVAAGNLALCIYDGTRWRYLPMASWTAI
jgi:hypothetical protein